LVERIESGGLEEFNGTVVSVEAETGVDERVQYHIKIDPEGIEVKGPTGALHEWIALSKTASETGVPQGSVVERYLTQIEICISAAKKANTVKEAFELMVGKKFRFKKIKLGKDFDGHKAKEYMVPVALVE